MNTRRSFIFAKYRGDNQQEFLDFILDHYVRQGVRELDEDKLPQLIELKYHSIEDAVNALGQTAKIRELFVGFQQHLYEEQVVA